MIQFFDETGTAPLPPIVRVTVATNTGIYVGQAYTQVGGFCSIALAPGISYVATFRGEQGPSSSIAFVGAASGTTEVTVVAYRSPTLDQLAYFQEELDLWPIGWFGTDVLTASTYDPEYATAYAAAAVLANLDMQEQNALAITRVQSCVGADIDSWANDFLGAGVFPRAPSEISGTTAGDASYLSRLFLRLALPMGTIAIIQQMVTWYLDLWINVLDLEGPIALDEAGALDTAGGLDSSQFTQASSPTAIVFDTQSNPTLAAAVGLQLGQFCILLGSAASSSLPDWFMGGSFIGVNTFLGGLPQYESAPSPSSLLDQLIASVKAEGTQPVYAQLATS